MKAEITTSVCILVALTLHTTSSQILIPWWGCTHVNTGRWGVEFVLWQRRRGRVRGSWWGTLVQEDAASRQAVLPEVPAAGEERGERRGKSVYQLR